MKNGTVGTVAAGIAALVTAATIGAGGFSDVPADHTHADGIEWVSGVGIAQGYPDGTYRPSAPINRGQMATMFHRQGAYIGPMFRATPTCGTTEVTVDDANHRGSGAADVHYSVNGGDWIAAPEIPAEGSVTIDVEDSGIVSVFVDGIQRAMAHTADACTSH